MIPKFPVTNEYIIRAEDNSVLT